MNEEPIELTVLMPCLNEAETVETCVTKACRWLADHGVRGEVLIADNGSTDGSQALARRAGARVISVAEKGYGHALRGGISAAYGRFVIMGDADDSYDFSRLEPFLERLRAGYDLVMGNRFQGGIAPGAMPPLHRYLGNPVLSGIGRILFYRGIGDFHCGLRGFRKDKMQELGLCTGGMEFATEMVVKAHRAGLRMIEVPTTLSPDGRSRPPHLRSWRDGWRHLRFMLLHAPSWCFLVPGTIALAAGAMLAVPGYIVLPKSGSGWIPTIAAVLILTGYPMLWLALLGMGSDIRAHARAHVVPRWVTFEGGLAAGGLLLVLGVAGFIEVWGSGSAAAAHYGAAGGIPRTGLFAMTVCLLGIQTLIGAYLVERMTLTCPGNVSSQVPPSSRETPDAS